MYTFIMRMNAAPGKHAELVGLLKTECELRKRLFSNEGYKVMTSVSGSYSEITCIWEGESVDQWQDEEPTALADPEILALLPKIVACILPNTLTTSILKHRN